MLFIFLPGLNRYARAFGLRVRQALNAPEPLRSSVNRPVPLPPVVEPHDTAPSVSDTRTPEAPRGYSQYEGFRSFAHAGGPTLEDIIKGLSREPASQPLPQESEPTAVPPTPGILLAQAMARTKDTEPAAQSAEEIVSATEVAATPEPVRPVATDTRGFLAALLEGDREAVFATLRHVARGGGSIEQFLTAATCALDDAYRARIDGTDCDPDIIRLSAKYQTPTLERVVAALTTAIDSSYTSGITGAKLALTRALAHIGA